MSDHSYNVRINVLSTYGISILFHSNKGYILPIMSTFSAHNYFESNWVPMWEKQLYYTTHLL